MNKQQRDRQRRLDSNERMTRQAMRAKGRQRKRFRAELRAFEQRERFTLIKAPRP
jgi:hypothetical protein